MTNQTNQTNQIKSQPKRIQLPSSTLKKKTSKISKVSKFELPVIKLNLKFFIDKGDEDLTVESLIEKTLGPQGKRLTPSEQIYIILSAMDSLGVVAPLELECEHCKSINPIAIELSKVMKAEGQSLEKFMIEHNQYIFEFVRPDEIHDTSNISSSVASLGMFMLQWLNAHNQGPDFDILEMELSEFLNIAKLFGEQMFGVTFKSKVPCNKCNKPIQEEFAVTLEDLVDILNDM